MKKQVLVVDDSALVRKELSKLMQTANFEVEIAKNGKEAVEKVLEGSFDVVTLDINMPVMDGLSALKEIMKKKPTPVVMVSSLTQGDADITFDALDNGAVDFVGKPGTITLRVKESGEEIIQKVKAASELPKNRLRMRKAANAVKAKLNKPVLQKTIKKEERAEKIVLVGSSTGGPGLIEKIAVSLPSDYPYPVCVVQHMPATFTAKFAQRLNGISNLNVMEAKNNEALTAGKMIIGKGGNHLHFSKKSSGIVSIKLSRNISNRFFVPSVDEMFFSATKNFDCTKILAIELTGIGDDGADGMVELKKNGAYTIAESKESATIYGMPKAAFDRGGTVEVLSFDKILKKILTFGDR